MPYFDDEENSINDDFSEETMSNFEFEEEPQQIDASMFAQELAQNETVGSKDTQNTSDADATVTAQPVKFASFEDLDSAHGLINQNLGILLDVKLQLTVELGKTQLPIKKVLELTKGSVVTLDKVAGEPVELYANGKLIAHGEVVVIEDNFGLRITHITPPIKRLDTFNQLPHEVAQQK